MIIGHASGSGGRRGAVRTLVQTSTYGYGQTTVALAVNNRGQHTKALALAASGKCPRRPPRYGQTLTGVKTWVTIAYGAK